jgi:hypothetical protein
MGTFEKVCGDDSFDSKNLEDARLTLSPLSNGINIMIVAVVHLFLIPVLPLLSSLLVPRYWSDLVGHC